MIPLNQYPQLQRLAWNRLPDANITEEAALELYERHWNLIDLDEMQSNERKLLHDLIATVGNGVLHV